MSTSPPLVIPTAQPLDIPDQETATARAAGTALAVALQEPEETGRIPRTGAVARLPVELDVAVAVRQFRVGDLLALAPGQVIESLWSHGSDVPLAAGDVQMAWSEFEVVDSQLAVRITRLP